MANCTHYELLELDDDTQNYYPHGHFPTRREAEEHAVSIGLALWTVKDNSYWHHDARGIPTGRVCDECEAEHEARFRPEVLTDANYDCDEPIDYD